MQLFIIDGPRDLVWVAWSKLRTTIKVRLSGHWLKRPMCWHSIYASTFRSWGFSTHKNNGSPLPLAILISLITNASVFAHTSPLWWLWIRSRLTDTHSSLNSDSAHPFACLSFRPYEGHFCMPPYLSHPVSGSTYDLGILYLQRILVTNSPTASKPTVSVVSPFSPW